MFFPDFGLQFLVVIILHSLTSYLKGCRFPGMVYTILISLTSYLKGSLTRIYYLESKLAINFIRIQFAPELCEEINLLVSFADNLIST